MTLLNAGLGLEIHAEQDPRLLAFEIDQIKRTDGGGGVARDLRAPCGRNPCALGEFDVYRRPNKKALSGERIQSKPIVFA